MSMIHKAIWNNLNYIIFIIIFLGMGHFMAFALGFTIKSNLNHFYILSADLGLFVSFLCLMSRIYNFPRVIFKWMIPFSILGYLVIFLLFITSMIVLMQGMTVVNERINFLFYFHCALMIYSFLCIKYFWTRYRVKEKNLLILDGKILYPNEIFTFWPLSDIDYKVINQDYKIPVISISIKCSDGTYKFGVNTSIHLDLEEVKERGVRHINFEDLVDDVKIRLIKELESIAKDKTFGEFITILKKISLDTKGNLNKIDN